MMSCLQLYLYDPCSHDLERSWPFACGVSSTPHHDAGKDTALGSKRSALAHGAPKLCGMYTYVCTHGKIPKMSTLTMHVHTHTCGGFSVQAKGSARACAHGRHGRGSAGYNPQRRQRTHSGRARASWLTVVVHVGVAVPISPAHVVVPVAERQHVVAPHVNS